MNTKEFKALKNQSVFYLHGYLSPALELGVKTYTFLTEKQQKTLLKEFWIKIRDEGLHK